MEFRFVRIGICCLLACSWWRDAQDSVVADSDSDEEGNRGVLCVAASAYGGPMKIINNIFNSDLVFNLRRREEDDDAAVQNAGNGEVGVSGRDYALVPGDMWVQALRWSVSIGIGHFNGMLLWFS